MRYFILMGVAGCGKTSVGEALAKSGALTYIDGDSLHPKANIEKMSSGIPLQDADREPWLLRIGEAFRQAQLPLIIGCSALKRAYRDLIRDGAGEDVAFIHLHAPQNVIAERMARREGHFMPPALLDSQFADLEELDSDETGAVIDISPPFGVVASNSKRAVQRFQSQSTAQVALPE